MSGETTTRSTIEVDTQFAIVPLWLVGALKGNGSAGSALMVYVSLGRWADYDTGECWPSHSTIAEMIGASRATVQRSLALLQEVGAVEVRVEYGDDGDQKSNRYRLRRVPHPRGGGCIMDEAGGASPMMQGGASPVKRGVHHTRSTNKTQKNKTQKNETQKNEHTLALAEIETSEHVVPTFDDWYAAYPTKKGKAEARKRWTKMTDADRGDALAALDSVRRQADHEGTRYIPHASTWLNQRRWEDEPWQPATHIEERRQAPGMATARARAVRGNINQIGSNQAALPATGGTS